MNFWHIQLHPDDNKVISKDIVRKIIQEKSIIGLGEWFEGKSLINQFKNEMQIGDIVVVRQGSTPIALVKIIGNAWFAEVTSDSFDWFPHRREVEVLDYYKPSYGFTILQARGTFSICRDLSKDTSKVIINWYKMYMSNKSIEKCISLLKYKHQIILQGPPGTGKTRQAKLIAEEMIKPKGEFKVIQFHPAYSYEDFVRGIVAEITENGSVNYKVENKILAEFSQKAIDNPGANYILIIDEINRANLPSVLGELIYALEYRDESVTSMYALENERSITLPKNLYIIGTMNTADRSVGHIDYAIRRRFAFMDILPDESVITNPKAKKLFNEVQALFSNEFLSPDFKQSDVMIGHSYFLTNDEDELKTKLEFEIKPILREYLKDGIFFELVSTKIEALHV